MYNYPNSSLFWNCLMYLVQSHSSFVLKVGFAPAAISSSASPESMKLYACHLCHSPLTGIKNIQLNPLHIKYVLIFTINFKLRILEIIILFFYWRSYLPKPLLPIFYFFKFGVLLYFDNIFLYWISESYGYGAFLVIK